MIPRDFKMRADYRLLVPVAVDMTLAVVRDQDGVQGRIMLSPDMRVTLTEQGAVTARARFRIRPGRWARISYANGQLRVNPWRWVTVAVVKCWHGAQYRLWKLIGRERQWWA